MKWLVLFPAWVFLVSYVIYRVKDANRPAPQEPAVVNAAGAEAIAKILQAAEPARVERPSELDGAEMVKDGQALAERVQLLPLSSQLRSSGISPLWKPGELGESDLVLASRASFDSWRLVEDNDLTFMIPGMEGYRVESFEGSRPIPMVGEYFHRVDRTPERWIRIVGPGESTWCALAIDRGSQFDSGERYPDPEYFHKLMLAGGGAMRASVGDRGALRRVQWLGDGIRVSLLDWQHCAVHAEAYAAFASGVQLRDELPEGRLALGRLAGGAGLETRLGLLERGMGEKSVEALLGRPVGVAGDEWVYHLPARGGDRYFRVPFVQGQFFGFRDGWREVRRDPPVQGSLAWMREKTSFEEGLAGGVGYDLGVLTDEEVGQIFNQVRSALPSADADEWHEYCEVLGNMAEMGLSDEGAVEILRRRFLEQALRPCRPAVKVLIRAGAERSRGLFVDKAKTILGDARWGASESERVAEVVDELELLFGAIGGDPQAGRELISVAANHPMSAVRAFGFTHWRLLSDDDRRPLLRSGMDDDAPSVRRRCAEAMAVACSKPVDRPMLQSLLSAETDAETREHLSRAIEALATKP